VRQRGVGGGAILSLRKNGGVAPSIKGGEGVQPESQINPKGGVQPSPKAIKLASNPCLMRFGEGSRGRRSPICQVWRNASRGTKIARFWGQSPAHSGVIFA